MILRFAHDHANRKINIVENKYEMEVRRCKITERRWPWREWWR